MTALETPTALGVKFYPPAIYVFYASSIGPRRRKIPLRNVTNLLREEKRLAKEQEKGKATCVSSASVSTQNEKEKIELKSMLAYLKERYPSHLNKLSQGKLQELIERILVHHKIPFTPIPSVSSSVQAALEIKNLPPLPNKVVEDPFANKNLNVVSIEELKAAKEEMDKTFKKTFISRDDPSFVFDLKKEFGKAGEKEKSEWDESDDEGEVLVKKTEGIIPVPLTTAKNAPLPIPAAATITNNSILSTPIETKVVVSSTALSNVPPIALSTIPIVVPQANLDLSIPNKAENSSVSTTVVSEEAKKTKKSARFDASVGEAADDDSPSILGEQIKGAPLNIPIVVAAIDSTLKKVEKHDPIKPNVNILPQASVSKQSLSLSSLPPLPGMKAMAPIGGQSFLKPIANSLGAPETLVPRSSATTMEGDLDSLTKASQPTVHAPQMPSLNGKTTPPQESKPLAEQLAVLLEKENVKQAAEAAVIAKLVPVSQAPQKSNIGSEIHDYSDDISEDISVDLVVEDEGEDEEFSKMLAKAKKVDIPTSTMALAPEVVPALATTQTSLITPSTAVKVDVKPSTVALAPEVVPALATTQTSIITPSTAVKVDVKPENIMNVSSSSATLSNSLQAVGSLDSTFKTLTQNPQNPSDGVVAKKDFNYDDDFEAGNTDEEEIVFSDDGLSETSNGKGGSF